jgi:hypothetical protein
MQELSPTCTIRKEMRNSPVKAITIFLPTAEVKKYDHFIDCQKGVKIIAAKVREKTDVPMGRCADVRMCRCADVRICESEYRIQLLFAGKAAFHDFNHKLIISGKPTNK